MKDDSIYITHILKCITDIERYVCDGKTVFFTDSKTYDAVLRKLQIMAESTQRLSISFKQQEHRIDWAAIAGFRNILVHDYLGDLDAERVWLVVDTRLSELKHILQQYI
jgi:uncharacterized protein with HEPN domain